MALQAPQISWNKVSNILTAVNGGVNASGSDDRWFTEGWRETWTYGYKGYNKDTGVELFTVVTDDTSFTKDLTEIPVPADTKIVVKQYKYTFHEDSELGNTETYDYSGESNVLHVFVEVKLSSVTYDKATGILHIESEPLEHHPSLDPVGPKAYVVGLSNGAAWDTTQYNTTSLTYDVPLTITESTDIVVWAVNADDSLSSPRYVDDTVGVFAWEEEASFTVQDLGIEIQTAASEISAPPINVTMDSIPISPAHSTIEAPPISVCSDSIIISPAESVISAPDIGTELTITPAESTVDAPDISVYSDTIVIPAAESVISAPTVNVDVVDIGDPVRIFRGLIQRLIFRGDRMDRPWVKYPYVEKTIRFDFNRKLAKGDYITEATVTVTQAGADVTSGMFSLKSLPGTKPRYCDARIKGGAVGLEYKAQCKIVSATGEKEEIVATIQVISDTQSSGFYASCVS